MSVDRYLAPNEEVLYSSVKHISVLYRAAITFAVAAFLGIAAGMLWNPNRGNDIVDLIAGVIVALMALRLVMALLLWRAERIVLTPRRLLVTNGLFRRKVTTVPLVRLREVTLARGVAGTLQRYGSVLCDVGDHGLIEIRKIPRVKQFYRDLVDAMSAISSQREDTPATRHPLPRSPLDDDDTGELPTVVL